MRELLELRELRELRRTEGRAGSALEGHAGSALEGHTGSALEGHAGSALEGHTGSDFVKLEVFLPHSFSLEYRRLVQAFVEAQQSEYFVW